MMPLTARAGEVTVFAASSLKTALDAIAPGFQQATGHGLTVSFAGSSVLARQIEAGAPADVFISASADWMDHLAAQGLIDAGSRRNLLGNSLVLIGQPQDAPLTDWADLPVRLGQGRLAMALVQAVPAGIYGKAALDSLGLWDQLAPQVAQADNVRAALALVALGEAPLGVVYATDAQAEPQVSVLATFPAGSHPPIVYPAARIQGSGAAAQDLLDYLNSAPARAVFADQGFALPED
ncbi:molybdate ABC transporter substrate-binding protein [Tropicibacter oceani]|uniref:Molybdate ABC transporter substrate-binding protein n=1 Tax=Tropicibacter oceani TaxID=3058420 RepID=A0ABY8QP98_9RHOB|nr:molybdate ABC transporter substrate-binding protein [Tropicibacter oceani]WGW05778.1 molybdate ABC transporter substrate-binding protein [Tropicibacter oceani]